MCFCCTSVKSPYPESSCPWDGPQVWPLSGPEPNRVCTGSQLFFVESCGLTRLTLNASPLWPLSLLLSSFPSHFNHLPPSLIGAARARSKWCYIAIGPSACLSSLKENKKLTSGLHWFQYDNRTQFMPSSFYVYYVIVSENQCDANKKKWTCTHRHMSYAFQCNANKKKQTRAHRHMSFAESCSVRV